MGAVPTGAPLPACALEEELEPCPVLASSGLFLVSHGDISTSKPPWRRWLHK